MRPEQGVGLDCGVSLSSSSCLCLSSSSSSVGRPHSRASSEERQVK